MKMEGRTYDLLEAPSYPLSEVAAYLGIPYQTVRYWVGGRGGVGPIVYPAKVQPPILSFVNLLECHVLDAMRKQHGIRLPVVRRAVETANRLLSSEHPLVEQRFQTDGVDLFIETLGREVLNLSRGGQLGLRQILSVYLQRIEFNAEGAATKFYPFVVKAGPNEPKIVSISPSIGCGRPVIDGTGIATAVIAARFRAREPISALAREYGRTEEEVEEAIRWETAPRLAA
jgi:uncharacterized protein (DUF433 family)